MWELYDALIDGIPPGIPVEDFNAGCAWSMVRAGGAAGVALTVKLRSRERSCPAPAAGCDLRALAQRVKSWNFTEASLGLAAINCWYNAPERLDALGLAPDGIGGAENDAFTRLAREAAGKRVAVIGHFPHLETTLAPVCELSILERSPDRGDYPDSACEYLLPEQELVFITGMTLVNKTLPRLLALCASASRVVLTGPSVPMAPILFGFGATDLDGFSVTDLAETDRIIRLGDNMGLFRGGRKVSLGRTRPGA